MSSNTLTSGPSGAKSALRKIPVASGLIEWLYRLIKLPSRFHDLNQRFWQLYEKLDAMDRKIQESRIDLGDMNGKVAFVSRDLEMIHETLKQKAGASQMETVKALAGNDFSSETYSYFAFENKFRGSKEEIRKVQLQYCPKIREAQERSKGSYLLDIGCGRGEFLKLLAEQKVPAKGIDSTKSMIEACREQNLDAETKDALDFLKSIPNDSLIGVTAFQMVEHVPPDYLIELLKACFSKIAKGGIIILETVNPGSLTSLMNFYIDLTHKNPIPPATLKFLVENSGFGRADIHYSSPIPEAAQLQGSDENILKLNRLLYGPQDYAIIGWK